MSDEAGHPPSGAVVDPQPNRTRRREGERLRQIRVARGLAQQDLARLAGITRQAVAAIEADRSEPSLRVALALAAATGTSVEELFGQESSQPSLSARPLAELGARGTRVALATVAGSNVALPMTGDAAMRAGFAPATGVVGTGGEIRPLGAARGALAIAGCDPALLLLETGLAQLDPPTAFAWWPCGSREALELVASGAVHAAGIHVRDTDGADYNIGAVRERFGERGALVYRFARWREGLVVRAEHEGLVTTVADVARHALRVALREPGAEARTLFERSCADAGVESSSLDGSDTVVRGHLQVASAIAAHLADVGVASEPAALSYGLSFVPLAEESYDLVIPGALVDAPEVHALLRVLRSAWLRAQIAALPAYDAANLGQLIFPLDAT